MMPSGRRRDPGTTGRRNAICGIVGLIVALPNLAGAAVTITVAPRTELLYSALETPDCTKLFNTTDDQLPQNVARLHALVDGAAPDASVRLQWSLRKGSGSLAADANVMPPGELPTVSGVCADFGNDCLLAADRLRGYIKSTILYVAPTCGKAGRDPSRPFNGEEITVRVKAFVGKRQLGRADVTFGLGHRGSATLFVTSGATGRYVDGLGARNGVGVALNPIFAANASPPPDAPSPPPGAHSPIVSYTVSGDLGGLTLPPSCSFNASFNACQTIVLQPGHGTENLTVAFTDNSALCDNIGVVVLTCSANPQLSIITKPEKGTYKDQSVVDTVVRLKNASTARDGLPPCAFLLQGQVLTCSEHLKVGRIEDTKDTHFGLPFCSKSKGQSCLSDTDCRPPQCPSCDPDERCLIEPLCSETTAQSCGTDADCRAPACPTCKAGEFCLRRLALADIQAFVLPGQSVDLLTSEALLRNRLGAGASLTDTWTVQITIPPISVSKERKYKIKPGSR